MVFNCDVISSINWKRKRLSVTLPVISHTRDTKPLTVVFCRWAQAEKRRWPLPDPDPNLGLELKSVMPPTRAWETRAEIKSSKVSSAMINKSICCHLRRGRVPSCDWSSSWTSEAKVVRDITTKGIVYESGSKSASLRNTTEKHHKSLISLSFWAAWKNLSR